MFLLGGRAGAREGVPGDGAGRDGAASLLQRLHVALDSLWPEWFSL